jgi:GNAT superfamily N-acetyltransferase
VELTSGAEAPRGLKPALPITTELAVRLETAEALDGVDCAEALAVMEPDSGAAAKAVAGGFLMYLGQASPLTHAVGIGMHGAVTAEQFEEIEQFYGSRETPITIDVCPYADLTLLELLNARQYRISEFTNVMVRAITSGEVFDTEDEGVEVRLGQEEELWARTVVCGFFGRETITDEEYRLGRILFHMPNSATLLATVAGEPAGAGAASFRERVANCFADATVVRYRRRGVHRALIRSRLEMAAQRGCDLITAGTAPGSGSQRDYERFGFQVAYTKITMTHE